MPDDDPEEANTLVACTACGGPPNHEVEREERVDGTYTVRDICPWCTEGYMSSEQGKTWARLHGIGRTSTPH